MRGGGAERVMLDLATGFSKLNFSVDLVLVKAEGPYLAFAPDTINIIDLGATRTLKSLPALVRYLRQVRPLAILSTIDHINQIVVWARILARVPVRVVVREADTIPYLQIGSKKRLMSFVHKQVKAKTYLLADKIVAVSTGVSENLQTFLQIPKTSIEVIYNPVDDKMIVQCAQESIDHMWFTDSTTPVILAVGRLAIQKDFLTLIHAFSFVRKRIKSKLLILGEGPERSNLEAAIIELGLENEVGLPGFCSNPFPYIAKAKALVLSSIHEGLPNVLIQSLVLGTPVVSTDCKSGPSEILDDGRYGRLVKVGNIEDLSKAIIESIESDIDDEYRRSLIERGRFYSVDTAIAAYKRVLAPDFERE